MGKSFPLSAVLSLVDEFSSPLGKAGGAVDGLAKKADRLGKKLTLGVTAPLAAFAVLSVKTGVDYQRSLNRVQAITGATAEEVQGLARSTEEALGARALPYHARQAAAAMAELAHTGHTVAEVQAELPNVIALAIATQEEEAVAAKATADVLDAYGLSAASSAKMTDLLAFAANRGQQELVPLAEGLKLSGRTAKVFGQDVEGTTAILNELADAGQDGAAGAAFVKRALATLARPIGATAKTLKRLRIEPEDLFDSKGQVRQLDVILETLTRHGATAKDAIGIFGTKAGPVLGGLLGQGARKAHAFADELRGIGGAAVELAHVQLSGGVQPIEDFTAKLEQLEIRLARSGLIEATGDLAGKAAGLFGWVAKLPQPVIEWGLGLGVVAAALGPLLLGIARLLPLAGALWKVAGPLVASLSGVAIAAAPWVALGVAVSSLASDFIDLWDAINGTSSTAAGPAKADRPAVDGGQFGGAVQARAAPAVDAALGRSLRAQGLQKVSGSVRVQFENTPPGTRVKARHAGDVPVEVDVGYNLAAGLAG